MLHKREIINDKREIINELGKNISNIKTKNENAL